MWPRVAWLLRANRIFHTNKEWSKAVIFASAFKGGSWSAEVSEARISRWETGIVKPPYAAIRRYEELLDLPPNSLVTVAETLCRTSGSPDGMRVLDRQTDTSDPSVQRRAEVIMEKVDSSSIISAREWDELTYYMSLAPNLMLMPSRLWDDIATRLLLETLVTRDCYLWMLRYESFSRLLTHPRGQVSAVAACANVSADPTNLLSVEPTSLLGTSSHQDANRFVLAQLQDPANEQAFYGALLAAVNKVRFRHLNEDQDSALARFIRETIQDTSGRYTDARAVAAQVVREATPRWSTDSHRSLLRIVQNDRAVINVLDRGRLSDITAATVVVDRLFSYAIAHLPHDGGGYVDLVLPGIIEDLVFDPVIDNRLNAGLLLLSSPYAGPVAAALSHELRNQLRPLTDVVLVRSLLGALRTLGTAKERDVVEGLVLEAVNPAIFEAATFAIGHIAGESRDSFWLQALNKSVSRLEAARTATNARTLTNLVYALGVNEKQQLLGEIHKRHPSPLLRTSAAWWSHIPHAVYEGGRH